VAYDMAAVAGLDTLTLSAYSQRIVKESKRNLRFGPRFFSNNFTTSDIDTVGLTAQGAKALGGHRLTFGLDAYQDDLKDVTAAESTFGDSNDVVVPESTQKAYGLYVQDEFALSSRFDLVAGARGDQVSFKSKEDPNYQGVPFDESNSAVSGSVGARYAVTEHVELTGTIGRAFRAPNIQERSFYGLASTGDTWVLQNPDLDPETALNADIGFKIRYSRYSGAFSLYNNTVKNLISLVFLGEDPNTGLEQARFENIDDAVIRGAELELQALLGSGFTGFLNTSYTYGRDENTGDPLPLIPPYKAVLGVRYERPRWWSEFSTRIVARQDRVPPDTTGDSYVETPGFTVYDIRGGVDLSHGFGIQAAAENLSDKAYSEPFNRRFEPGRNFKVGVRYSF
jgi:hemoglobin/transferrin/lactoferrin receptor protein